MLRRPKPRPMAILSEVRQTTAIHRATARQCIDTLQSMSGETRDRIAISLALLGRVSDRRSSRIQATNGDALAPTVTR